MTDSERIQMLEEAQEKINEAVHLIRGSMDGTNNEAYSERYIIGHLSNWANGGNPHDETIPVLIEKIQNEEIYT